MKKKDLFEKYPWLNYYAYKELKKDIEELDNE